ncbi:probable receptor-like serine/threonine-protein kinase At5g57670 [Mangifera indica]|uniref:probable receptor-like serine/threonine-protein kinase At5g57670 n=1 Tax=Mangifera indica TaxID=29780 RepID=UPI001CFBC01F|nr:probable receptor-like serine/threonine-protein kinase At5g57670 [Mangifera indica]
MFSSTASSSKILVAISLDPDESKELLSWAVTVLAHPNDSIVAIHVLVGEESKKLGSISKRRYQIRQAKAYVISILGDFANTCQSKQINLEAKVGFSSSFGRGLIQEAEFISADFLLLHGSRNRSPNKFSQQITRYCLENAPEGCTIVSVGKCVEENKNSSLDSSNSAETHQLDSNHLSKITNNEKEHIVFEKTRSKIPSPITVFDQLEEESNSTEDDTFSAEDSSTISQSPPLQTPKFKGQFNKNNLVSPYRLITSILNSPWRRRNRSLSNKERHQPLLKCFSFMEISKATNNFHPDNMVGQGGYSEVYKGNLSDGRTIAVKRLAKDNKNANKEKEFLMELGIIGHVCHPNTATLVGCCIENGLYLIFNFSQNGNLESAIHGKRTKSLDWPVRYKIALGVARGLHYLHKCCKHRIIHRDIKASNVLLGPDYEPQITDFGLAKWLPNKWTHHAVIPIEGTFGYLAPEYFMHGIVDEKTDVFAFGVLLLEIITGRKPVDSSQQNLLLWAKPFIESGNITELIDPSLENNYDSDQLHRLVLASAYCVRQSSIQRPSMSEVLELLTNGHGSEVAKSWRMPKLTSDSDELNDFSMFFGYQVPTDIDLEEFL